MGQAVREQCANSDEEGQISTLLQTVAEMEEKSGHSAEEAAIRTGTVSGGNQGGPPDLAEAGRQLYALGVRQGWVQPLPGDAAVLRPRSPPIGRAEGGPSEAAHTTEVAQGITISTYHLLSQEITAAILAASGCGQGLPNGAAVQALVKSLQQWMSRISQITWTSTMKPVTEQRELMSRKCTLNTTRLRTTRPQKGCRRKEKQGAPAHRLRLAAPAHRQDIGGSAGNLTWQVSYVKHPKAARREYTTHATTQISIPWTEETCVKADSQHGLEDNTAHHGAAAFDQHGEPITRARSRPGPKSGPRRPFHPSP